MGKLTNGDGAAVFPRYRLDAYTVKRKAADVWEIWHGGAIVCTLDQARALAFIRGEIDPLTLGNHDQAKSEHTAA